MKEFAMSALDKFFGMHPTSVGDDVYEFKSLHGEAGCRGPFSDGRWEWWARDEHGRSRRFQWAGAREEAQRCAFGFVLGNPDLEVAEVSDLVRQRLLTEELAARSGR
jgi:hypothetical protein